MTAKEKPIWRCECGCTQVQEHNTGGDLEIAHRIKKLTLGSDGCMLTEYADVQPHITGTAAETWFECCACDYELTSADIELFANSFKEET